MAAAMPSPLPRVKSGNTRKGIGRQRKFKPALKEVKSLIVDIENSENPEDDEFTSETYEQQKSSSSSSNVVGLCVGSRSAANRGLSPDSILKRHRLVEEFDGDPESEDSEGDFEERSKARVLTEVERLEEAQTALEDKVKATKELLQRKDRTRKQRNQAQQKLERLEAKLEVLDQRLEAERAGKSRWTFIKRPVRRSKVGFHSSDLLKRKVPLGLLAASLDTQADPAEEVAIQDMESKSEELDVQLEESPPSKPPKMFKTKALREFHFSLQEERQDKRKVAKSGDDAVNGSLRNECRKSNSDVENLEEIKDRKEVDKGWLRISDRPKDFLKKIDLSETHQTKEAWVNVNQHGQQMFARKVLRAHMNGNDPRLSRPLDGKAKSTLGVLGGKLNIGNRRASKSSSEKSFDSNKERSKEGEQSGRISSSSSRRPKVVRMENIGGTTSFLPPIPKYEAKKRPKQEQIERTMDENDKKQKKERLILIPNRKRVAKKRAELYLKQLEFVRAHGLDQKDVLKHVGKAVQEHGDSEVITGNHQPISTPRSTLYLIGALSRTHLQPPTAPQINEN